MTPDEKLAAARALRTVAEGFGHGLERTVDPPMQSETTKVTREQATRIAESSAYEAVRKESHRVRRSLTAQADAMELEALRESRALPFVKAPDYEADAEACRAGVLRGAGLAKLTAEERKALGV